MTSHDVCRQHRRLPWLGQWPAALAVPCPGWQGMRRSGARGRGAVWPGAGRGTCRSYKAGEWGRTSSFILAAGPRRGDRDLSGWDGEKGRPGMGIRQKTGMARSPARHLGAFAAQAAQTRHRRYCATVIFRGMACPRMVRRRASPGLLPRWGRAPCT